MKKLGKLEEEQAVGALAFDWRGGGMASGWRLMPYFLGCVLVLLVLSFVVRTVEPEGGSLMQSSQTLLVLDWREPSHQALLLRAERYSSLPLHSFAMRGVGDEAALLPKFKPSFSGYEMKLKLPEVEMDSGEMDFPRLFRAEDTALARLDLGGAADVPMRVRAAPAGSYVLRAVLQGELDGRVLVRGGEVEMEAAWETDRNRFEVLVNDSGRVVMALPLLSDSGEQRSLVTAVQAEILSWRFAPVESGGLMQGELRFEWQRKEGAGR
jgi:hypothetical protein